MRLFDGNQEEKKNHPAINCGGARAFFSLFFSSRERLFFYFIFFGSEPQLPD